MDRRHFLYIAGTGLGALIIEKSQCQNVFITDHIKLPNRILISFAGSGVKPMQASGNGSWNVDDADVTINELTAALEVSISSPSKALMNIMLEWDYKTDPSSRVLGDHWERSYGDIYFAPLNEPRVLPWYFIQHANAGTHCFGVKTGPSAFCSWSISPTKLQLVIDTRNGGNGVELGSRILKAATIVTTKNKSGENVFSTAKRFCTVMCDRPKMPAEPIYGINDWYITYGKNSAKIILDHTKLMSEFIPDSGNRPFSVIDSGWAQYSPLLPGDCCWQEDFGKSNENFGDMSKLASEIKGEGMRPGLWTRPLCARHDDKRNRLLPVIPGRDKPTKPVLDPTIEENLQRISDNVIVYRHWGFEMIKHDFTTYDMFGKWGFDMKKDITSPGWNFHQRDLTNAEIILQLYKKIVDAAGSMYLLGCNTISHLSAGLFEINRIGDDTSGKEWERTKKMGVNTLGFRLIQHGTFYSADGDCVGLTDKVPWEKNRQWMQLLAESGTPLFISAQKEVLGNAQKQEIKKSFQLASRNLPAAEPLDWLRNPRPATWKLNGKIVNFEWD
jgi:alpha-galactosidase